MIYFDKATQQRLSRFREAAGARRTLLVGHSESLLESHRGFKSLGQTIYRRGGAP